MRLRLEAELELVDFSLDGAGSLDELVEAAANFITQAKDKAGETD